MRLSTRCATQASGDFQYTALPRPIRAAASNAEQRWIVETLGVLDDKIESNLRSPTSRVIAHELFRSMACAATNHDVTPLTRDARGAGCRKLSEAQHKAGRQAANYRRPRSTEIPMRSITLVAPELMTWQRSSLFLFEKGDILSVACASTSDTVALRRLTAHELNDRVLKADR